MLAMERCFGGIASVARPQSLPIVHVLLCEEAEDRGVPPLVLLGHTLRASF